MAGETYSERMKIGVQRAIAAGVDPRQAPFVASQYMPVVDSSTVWNRPAADTPMVVQGVKNFADGVRQVAGFPDSNPLAGVTDRLSPAGIWGAYTQATKPIADVFAGVPTELARATETPKEAAVRRSSMASRATATAPSNIFPQSYKDDSWGKREALAEQKYGLPAGILSSIRTKGERSNSDQVSEAGARTVYQFIPATAAGIKKNYGVDVFASPENATIGAALLMKENLQRNGGDVQAAIGEYHGGSDRRNWGPRTQAYMDRVLGPGGAGFVNPFDPGYYNAAMGEINKAETAALQPTQVSFDPGLAPTMPDPVMPERTDWTAADQALQALRPAELQEKQLLREKRAAFFGGLAQAMAATPDGAGLGKVLGMLGAGALGGAAAGEKAVRDRIEAFDDKMAKFNLAVYSQEMTKAKTLHDEAQYEAATLNQFGMQKWQTEYQRWQANAQPMVTSDAIITRSVGADGKMTINRVPIASAVKAEAAMKRAQVFQGMAGDANTSGRMVAQAQNGMLANVAGALMSQDMARGAGASAEASNAAVAVPVFMAGSIVDSGQAASLVGAEGWKQLTQQAQQQAMAMYPEGGSAYNEAVRSNIVTELTRAFTMGDKSFQEKFMKAGSSGNDFYMAEQFRNRSTRTSRDAKGRTSTSVTE